MPGHDSEPPHPADVSTAPALPGAGPGARVSQVRTVLLALLAGIVAGLISWLGSEAAYREFTPSADLARAKEKAIAISALAANDPKMAAEEDRQIKANEARNVAFSAGLLGGAVGLALGLAGGIAARSMRKSLSSALAGLILGGAAGAFVPWVVLPLYYRFAGPASASLVPALLLHGSLWSAAGIAGGLALGAGLGGASRVIRTLVGGLLGAWLGTLVYEFAGALAFPPTTRTYLPIAMSSGARLVGFLAVAILTALVAAAAAAEPARAPIG